MSQIGRIEEGRIFQAKGRASPRRNCLATRRRPCRLQMAGSPILSVAARLPSRAHAVVGHPDRTLHVPGRLFSVAPWAVREVPRLFARNERLVCHFETDFGPMCMVMVGALLVSGVETVWNGVNIPGYASRPWRLDFPRAVDPVDRFAEMARFNYGRP